MRTSAIAFLVHSIKTDIAFLATRSRFQLHYWRNKTVTRLKAVRAAYRYVAGTLTKDDAEHIIIDCQPVAGWHPLVTLAESDVLDNALEAYADHPALPSLVAQACGRVGRKWDDNGETLYGAREWALEEVEGYARDASITLVRIDDDEYTGDNQGPTPPPSP